MSCGTLEEWNDWEMFYKTNHKYLYWFTEKFLDKLQDIVLFPDDLINSVRVYTRNRWVTKTHLIQLPLKRGQWHETDDRMLYGMFVLLTTFIEVEKANLYDWCSPPETKFKWIPRTIRLLSKMFSVTIDPKKGLSYLEWEMSLVDDNGNPTEQAKKAKEQLELYKWWKEVRPLRKEIYTSDLSFEQMEELETLYNMEDQEMLIRLITIRQSLWT